MTQENIYAKVSFNTAEKILLLQKLSNHLLGLESKLTLSKRQNESDFYINAVAKTKELSIRIETNLGVTLPLTEAELDKLRHVISPYPNDEVVHDSVLGKLDRPLENDTSQDGGSIFEDE
ncbi:MAG: hypothetical protein HRU38_07080 [Saccharospirillaceae bacterium]|nr:hypothetical protein [Saccharospirillaceae bacterium]